MNFLGISVAKNITKEDLLEEILNNLLKQKKLNDKIESKTNFQDSEELRNAFSKFMLPKALLTAIYKYIILDKEIITELASRVENPEIYESSYINLTAESGRAYEIIRYYSSIIKHPAKILINTGSEDKPCLIEIDNPDQYPVDRTVPKTFEFDGKKWKIQLNLPTICFDIDNDWEDRNYLELKNEYFRRLEINKEMSNRLYNDFQMLCQLDFNHEDNEKEIDLIFNDIEGLNIYLHHAKSEFKKEMFVFGPFEIIFKEISEAEKPEKIHWNLNRFIPFVKSPKENLIQNIHRLLL